MRPFSRQGVHSSLFVPWRAGPGLLLILDLEIRIDNLLSARPGRLLARLSAGWAALLLGSCMFLRILRRRLLVRGRPGLAKNLLEFLCLGLDLWSILFFHRGLSATMAAFSRSTRSVLSLPARS